MRKLRIAILACISLFVVIFSMLWCFNHFFNEVHIPLYQIGAVTAIYVLYLLLLSLLFAQLWDATTRKRFTLLLLYLFICLTLIPTVDNLVYVVFPKLGIYFFDERLPRDDVLFHQRIWRGYVFVHVCAYALVVCIRLLESVFERRRLADMLSAYQARAEAIRYTSHFLNTIFASTFGRMLVDYVGNDKGTKRDIIQFLGYLMRVDKLNRTGEWKEELDQLACFVRLLRAHFGARAIVTDIAVQEGKYPPLPEALLFFPLENCLRHALISIDHPVHYQLLVQQDSAVLCCRNYRRSAALEHDGGTGFDLLRAKVEQSAAYTITWATEQINELYTLNIHLSWSTDAKTDV